MAISTFGVFLMSKSGSTYSKLVDIKDYGDLIGERNALETTTMSDPQQTFIPGIRQTGGAINFTCNYDDDTYDTLVALDGTETDFAVWFGGTESGGIVTPTGSEGKFEFKGFLAVNIPGKGVDEVVDMVVSIMPTTAVTKASA